MRRLFTFGCSFTDYINPTWADILAIGFDHYENWGRSAHGNVFIAHRVAEAIAMNTITKDDVFVIVWSDHLRFDTFKNILWDHHRESDGPFDPLEAYYGSFSAIQMTIGLLESKGINYWHSAIKPLHLEEYAYYDNRLESIFAVYPQFQIYEKMLSGPRWLETFEGGFFDYFWESQADYKFYAKEPQPYVDRHPTPLMHGQWVSQLVDKLGFADYTRFQRQAEAWQGQLDGISTVAENRIFLGPENTRKYPQSLSGFKKHFWVV